MIKCDYNIYNTFNINILYINLLHTYIFITKTYIFFYEIGLNQLCSFLFYYWTSYDEWKSFKSKLIYGIIS